MTAPNWTLVLTLGLFLAVVFWLIALLALNVRAHHQHLASIMEEARTAKTEEHLLELRSALRAYRARHCTCRRLADHADLVDTYIWGRIQGIRYAKTNA